MPHTRAKSKAAGVFALPMQIYRLRRGAGGREILGGSHKALLGALMNAGIRVLIVRRTYPELESTMIAPFLKLIGGAVAEGRPAGHLVADYNATQRTVFFSNGSVVKFGHLQNQASLSEYQGQEYDWIFIDEATHFTEYEFRTLGACLRGVNPFPKRMYLTCNPGGVGHQWVKRLFVTRQYDLVQRKSGRLPVYSGYGGRQYRPFRGRAQGLHRLSGSAARRYPRRPPLWQLGRDVRTVFR
jgi:hypothetical protein